MKLIKQRPQVLFLDAVGTLFGVKGSVGEQYVIVAKRFGVTLSAEAINQAFANSFTAAGQPAFPDSDRSDLPAQEFAWWRAIAIDTFTQAEAIHQFSDFDAFFVDLFQYFATAEPWILYPDVIPALQSWQKLGISLGILSNFDSRLYSVLWKLGLRDYFESVTISSEAGSAKPDRGIFTAALYKHHVAPTAAWHIGDSYKEDYQAAQAAGLRGIWLKR